MSPEDDNNENMILEGYAVVFESPAEHKIYDTTIIETIKKDALSLTDMSDVVLRYNHLDSHMLLARTQNNSLTLTLDNKGLYIKASLIDTQVNRDLYKSVKAGLITKMSFAFTIADGGEQHTFIDNLVKRDITNIDRLYDVSIVDSPFYDTTSVYARCIDKVNNLILEKQKRKVKFKYE